MRNFDKEIAFVRKSVYICGIKLEKHGKIFVDKAVGTNRRLVQSASQQFVQLSSDLAGTRHLRPKQPRGRV
jgi:hypothetical protein